MQTTVVINCKLKAAFPGQNTLLKPPLVQALTAKSAPSYLVQEAIVMLTNQIRLNSTLQSTDANNRLNPDPQLTDPQTPAVKSLEVKSPAVKSPAVKPSEVKSSPQKRRNSPTPDWEKAKRKRARKGSKDWRRQRLEWRDTDKERRQYQQRWMKFSKKPGKKPLAVFTHRSNCIGAPHIPLNQILNLVDR
jgi:hypothetical protein